MGALRRHQDGRAQEQRAPSLDDNFQAEATAAAAQALGNALERVGIGRPIRTLTFSELEMLAREAITGWVLKRAEQGKIYDTEIVGSVTIIGG